MAPESALIATHSGLRGRPEDGLTPERVRASVAAFVGLLEQAGLPRTIGLARDARPSSAALARAGAEGATGAGCEVADFGVVSTPAAKLAARRRGLGGAVVVTGSHLEPDWNGIKLAAAPDYAPVDVRDLPEARAGSGPTGTVHRAPGVAQEHADAVCASVDRDTLARAGLSVAVEGGAGPAPVIALAALGCDVVADGADARLRLDADGDRLRLADHRGRALDEEATLPLVAIAKRAARIVKGADTSAMVDLVVRERGGWVRVVPPGELHLVRALAESGGDLAGEGNGGVVVPQVGMARDGLAAGVAVLGMVAASGVPLAEHAAALPRLARRRSSVPSPDPETGWRAVSTAADRLGAAAGDADKGVTVDRPGGAWALVRRSATEPVVRVTVEAATENDAEELHREVLAALNGGT